RTQRSRSSFERSREAESDVTERGGHRAPAPFFSEPESPPETESGSREPEGGLPESRERRRIRDRDRPSASPGRSRLERSSDSEKSPLPKSDPDAGFDLPAGAPEGDDAPRPEEPPRRRGGRAAIRSRGGTWHSSREAGEPRDIESERLL